MRTGFILIVLAFTSVFGSSDPWKPGAPEKSLPIPASAERDQNTIRFEQDGNQFAVRFEKGVLEAVVVDLKTPIPPEGILPKGKVLVEIRPAKPRDWDDGSLLVGYPKEGRIWKLSTKDEVVSWERMKPWKSKQKGSTLREIRAENDRRSREIRVIKK